MLSGFSIDLWRAIAARSGLAFEFIVKDAPSDLLASVRAGESDAAIAAVSITAAREEEFDFSLPILAAGLQVMVREPGRDASLADNLGALLRTPALYELLGVLVLLALVPVPFVLWAERRSGGGIVGEGTRRQSFGRAFFWSLTVLGGHNAEMPASRVGRMVAVIVVFASVIFVSYFTATTTALLTVRELGDVIRGAGDLPGRVVGTVRGTTAAAYLAGEGIRTVSFAQLGDAIAELDRGRLDAIVYDAPVLQYVAAHEGHGRVETVGPVFRAEQYGVLLPSGSRWRKAINTGLLAVQESGDYRAIHANWFGQE